MRKQTNEMCSLQFNAIDPQEFKFDQVSAKKNKCDCKTELVIVRDICDAIKS